MEIHGHEINKICPIFASLASLAPHEIVAVSLTPFSPLLLLIVVHQMQLPVPFQPKNPNYIPSQILAYSWKNR